MFCETNVTLTFDFWPPNSNEFIFESKWMFTPSLEKSLSGRIHRTINMCRWPLTPKIVSAYPWLKLNICTRFEIIPTKGFLDIVFTTKNKHNHKLSPFTSISLPRHKLSQALTTFWGFIWAVGAVDVVVAHKVFGDALSVLAHELILGITRVVGVRWRKNTHTHTHTHWSMDMEGFCITFMVSFESVPLTAAGLHALICSIRTVFVSIALPALWDTHVGTGTLESLGTAGLGFCDNVMGKITLSWTPRPGLGVYFLHRWVWVICHLLHFWSSSEPSPQSSEPSHTQWLEIQRWFPHSNWVDVQNLSAKERREGERERERIQHFREIILIHPDRNSCFPCAAGSLKKNTGYAGMLCVREDDSAEDWPQWVSSAPFSQSFSLSQVQLMGMQRPLGQAKKFTGHFGFLLSAGQQLKTTCKIYENVKNGWIDSGGGGGEKARNLGSSSHRTSLHSRCCRHRPTRADNTEWFSHSSGRTRLSLRGGRNGNNLWPLRKKGERIFLKRPLKKRTHRQRRFCLSAGFLNNGRSLTAVHFIACVFTVDHLVTAAEVGDAASVFALELSYFAQGHCRKHSIEQYKHYI